MDSDNKVTDFHPTRLKRIKKWGIVEAAKKPYDYVRDKLGYDITRTKTKPPPIERGSIFEKHERQKMKNIVDDWQRAEDFSRILTEDGKWIDDWKRH